VTAGLALSLAAGPVFAQQGGRGRGGGAGLSLLALPAPLAEKLMLTADQKTKLQDLQTKLQSDSQAARQAANGDRQAAAQKTRELSMKAQADAAALLTEDQKKTWEGWMTQYRGVAGLGRSGAALLMVSGITDEQMGKLKTLATDTMAKRREIMQAANGDRQAAAEKTMALDADTQTAVKAILNADQGKQFDAGIAALPRGRRRGNQQ
jgi:hypothetical protein